MAKEMDLLSEIKAPKIINPVDTLAKKRAEDERMVRGTFVYRAKPGGRYRTTLRKYRRSLDCKNAQGFVPVDMTDGKSYTVPYWVAEWINGEAELGCADIRHEQFNLNVESGEKPTPRRVPVFRFIIQDYA